MKHLKELSIYVSSNPIVAYIWGIITGVVFTTVLWVLIFGGQ